MSLPNKGIHTDKKIIDFYNEKVRNFGNSAPGVGWKDDQAQLMRFTQLVQILQKKTDFSINDLGCGTGHLYKYLLSKEYYPRQYNGYDILEEMIQLAELDILPDRAVSLLQIQSPIEMKTSDYTVASGIFNVKYEVSDAVWLEHIISTIELMNEKSKLGFAFNLLTKYSDPEFMQSYLYYADPLFLFDFCKKKMSKNVALLHDYFQYDFTIIVRK